MILSATIYEIYIFLFHFRNANNSSAEQTSASSEGYLKPKAESQYVDIRTISSKRENTITSQGSNMNLVGMADGNVKMEDDVNDGATKPRKPLERRESSRLQNAAKKLRRSLSSKVVSNKHNNSAPANDDYVDIRSLGKENHKNKTKEENKINTDIEKNGDGPDGKRKRRSSASTFFLAPHISHTSEIFKSGEKSDAAVKGTNKTKEKRSHSFNGRSDAKKAAKLANLVRRDSSSNVGKRQIPNTSSKQTIIDMVSNNPNGSSKSCEDLLDTSSNNIYAEIPPASAGASFSGAVPTPYCTISELFHKPEETLPGAKSILLTEDNLIQNIANVEGSESEYVSKGPPDLIQNLPHSNSTRQVNTYVSKSYSILRAEDNYSDYDYVDEFRSSNIASTTGFRHNLLNHNVGKDHEEQYSSIIR